MIGVAVVAAAGELAEVRVLARSIAQHHPQWRVSALVLPGFGPELRPGDEPFELIDRRDVAGREHESLLGSASASVMAALLCPVLVAHLLDAGRERVLLLAPDAQVYGPLDALLERLAAVDAVVVPRLTGSLPEDARRPDGKDLLDAGETDDGVVAVRGTERGRAFVEWWAERALEAATAAAALPAQSSSAATRLSASPLGAASRVLPGLELLDDAGYDVSYWNLHERPLARVRDGVAAAERPLRLMRWAGFRPDRPWWLSEHATRTLVLDDPVLTELVAARARDLDAAGWIRLDGHAVSTRDLPNGVRYDERLQRLHAEAADGGEDFGDVFSPAGAEAFVGWLAEAARSGGHSGVNRYSFDVWRERPDIQVAYPDLDGADADGFLGWLWVHGRPELGLQEALLPAPPDWVEAPGEHVPAVIVSGYLRGNLGLGQAARAYADALRAADVPVATRSVPVDRPVAGSLRAALRRAEERSFTDLALSPGVEPEINLLCVNADQVPSFVEELGDQALDGRYTIGHWAWETDVVPPSWNASFDRVDELWAISRFVAENLSRVGDLPVVVVPLPVAAPDAAGARVPFEMPRRFTFLFAFDFLSTIERKNPVGLIEAFKQAFTPNEGPGLLVKTINAPLRPEATERLRYAAAGREDIRLVDAALEPQQLAAVFAQADCYVSLHRAEGFGLTLAESMALGKPVIATGYSGNADFMTPANSYLVDWRLRTVGPDAEHYPAEGHWAEPDLEHAAALMREVWKDQDAARTRGARAADDVRASLSAEAVGRIARARLVRIAARVAARPIRTETWPHPDLPGRLHFDLEGRRGSGRKSGQLLRRGLFRTLRPYTSSQRRLDELIVDALRRIDLERSAERAQLERERERAALRDRRLAQVAQQLEAVAHEQARLRGALAGVDLLAMRDTFNELHAAARGVPYMAGDPFTYFTDPVAGRVFGYRGDAGAAVSGEEAYRAFEDVFRGSRERVRALVEPYVDLLQECAPVLDVGCGRGELLEALRAAGIEARGVDVDAGMVQQARQQGLDVDDADGLEHLAQTEAASLGAVVSIQVVEHLPRASLLPFLITARDKLRPGGLFVAETVNPHAAHALKTFWVDLTHQHPLFPEVMLALAADAGYGSAFICHMLGTRDGETDRFRESSYALVARK